MKHRLNKTLALFKQLDSRYELKAYAFVISLIVVLLLLIFYLLAASHDTTADSYGLGLLKLQVGTVSPIAIFTAGALLSLVIGTYMFLLFINRIERLDKSHKKEVEKTKNELLALASHQLRTPASGVKQYLGMVLEGYTGSLKPEQKSLLKKAYSSNERQIETINQLLYVAQADAGELRLIPSTFNIAGKINKVLEDLANQAEEKDITIKFPKTKPIYVYADKRFIRMILENLISNAIKYSYESSAVKISASRKGKQVIVKVTDHGVGISEHDFPKLFLKFSRINNELSHAVGGSGIGLFLSQRLAKAHKGVIKVISEKTKGSTFTLALPVASVGMKKIGGYPQPLANKPKGVVVG